MNESILDYLCGGNLVSSHLLLKLALTFGLLVVVEGLLLELLLLISEGIILLLQE